MRLLPIFKFILTLSALGTSSLCADSNPPPGRIAVVVGKSIITEGELLNRLRFVALNSGITPSQANLASMEQAMLRTMIDERLQVQAAEQHNTRAREADKIKITDADVDEAIATLEKASGMPKGHILRALDEHHIPISTLKNQIRANRMWVEFMRQEHLPMVQVADTEVAQELDRQKEKETKAQYHLTEIVLFFDNPEQEKRIKADLERLVGELQKGAHFSALAQQFSQAPTAATGGDMGWITEDELAPEIREALSHMDVGQLSKPIRMLKSYTIIGYLEEKPPRTVGQTLVSLTQVLFPFPSRPTEPEVIAIMEKAQRIGRAAKDCSDLEKRAKAAKAGAQVRSSPDQPLDTMPRALRDIVEKLPVNKSTDPLLTENGGMLIMVCSKRIHKPEPVTEASVRSHLLEQKLQELARRELRDLRRTTYIDFRRPTARLQ